MERVIAAENFESDGARPGDPQIVSGVVSPGLLTPTRQAVYRTDGEWILKLPHSRAKLPSAGAFYRAVFRLYSFSEGAEISFRFTDMKGVGVDRKVVKPKGAKGLAAVLPVDVAFVVSSDGEAECTLTSLVDGSVQRVAARDSFFSGLGTGSFDTALVLTASAGGSAEMTVDEIEFAVVREAKGSSVLPPFSIEREATADRMKRTWELVFEDEFEGPEGAPFDAAKWYVPSWRKTKETEGYARLDGKGHLELLCDFKPGTTNLQSTALWSVEQWQYGYFEAKVRFTRNNGWWAAFWLYSQSNRNAVECGSEIDIFEDYFTRYPKSEFPVGTIPLDHNIHVSYGPGLKSTNHRSATLGSLDDFHTIGCKWTPFEISYYLDGKIIRSTSHETCYDTVTFDAFNQNAIAAPLHAVLSGQILRGWGPRDTRGFTFPERYLVDSVRVWKYPQGREPKVTWKNRPNGGFASDGDVLTFEVDVKATSKIKAVSLFDNGAFIAARTEPPWTFSVPMSKSYYEGTHYMRPGRQKKKPKWDGLLHSFLVFVQDEEGRVGVSDGRVRVVPTPAKASTPKDGQPLPLPGTLVPARYDDGGDGVGFCHFNSKISADHRGALSMLHTGEWLKYTVEVAETGDYEANVSFGDHFGVKSQLELWVDGKTVAVYDQAGSKRINLTKGRHVLTVLPVGFVYLKNIVFSKK